MLQNFWIGTDFGKLLSSLPVQNETVKALMDSQVKNLKAIEEANQHAIDAFHAVFNRQNELLHATLEEMCKATMGLSGQPGPDAFAQHAAAAMAATERTLANLRDMSETVAQASRKANQVLNERLQQTLQELHALNGR